MAAGGFHVNHQKCQDYTQFIVPERHILANGVSVVRVGEFFSFLATFTMASGQESRIPAGIDFCIRFVLGR